MEPITKPNGEWLAQGDSLSSQNKINQWAIVDWLLAGLSQFAAKEVYAAAEKLFPQYTRITFYNMASVGRAYQTFPRGKVLHFGHYKIAINLQEPWRSELLAKADAGGWSVSKLAEAISDLREGATPEAEPESTPESESTPEAAATRQTGRKPRPAFTLAALSNERRAQLEKLVAARRVR